MRKKNLSPLKPLFRTPGRGDAVIGQYVKQGFGEYGIRYHHPFFQQFYWMKDWLWNYFSDGSSEKRLLHHLRRANSRNILTFDLVNAVAKKQKDYLSTGDFMSLKPLTQVELAKRMNPNSGKLDPERSHICHTWLSRLISNLSMMMADGSQWPLSILLPTQRERIKQAVREVLKEESCRIMEGVLQVPYPDSRLRELLNSRFEIATTTRNIAGVRRELGISSARLRGHDFSYLFEIPFSDVYVFSVKSIAHHVPHSSGIYELRLKEELIKYPKGASAIFYIGRSKNLRKRLMEHLRARSKNETIAHYFRRGICGFRFLIVEESFYRQEEKRIYDLFSSTFGAPPAGNRVSPDKLAEKCLRIDEWPKEEKLEPRRT